MGITFEATVELVVETGFELTDFEVALHVFPVLLVPVVVGFTATVFVAGTSDELQQFERRPGLAVVALDTVACLVLPLRAGAGLALVFVVVKPLELLESVEVVFVTVELVELV